MAPLNYERLHPHNEPTFARFPSRRSTIFSTKGAVATSQPLACQAGLEILNKGGNAADAAVAVAAALNVTEPSMTGLGGDVFCLYWDAKSKTVKGVNGSGKSPKALTLAHVRSQGFKGLHLPVDNINAVTVPGAAAGWCKTIETFGSGMPMTELLGPAMRMAREGVPAHEISSRQWHDSEALIKSASPNWPEMMMPHGGPPRISEIMTHPELADVMQAIAEDGPAGFYRGRIAQEIVNLVKSRGGVMELEDLADCQAEVTTPIKYTFKVGQPGQDGVTLWECPPNGCGIAALLALGIVEAFEVHSGIDVLDLEHNSALYLHICIEALKLAFADTRYYVTDPEVAHVPIDEMLSKSYLQGRAALIQQDEASFPERGDPVHSSDTTLLVTADQWGNSCSFIASNFEGFGTGAIPKGCGFTLQNRGSGFTCEQGHPNCLQGGKRPYHTIIPGMVTRGDELLMSFGVMGGVMQPQGHLQVLLNKLRGFSVQACLDAPRFCIVQDGTVWLEDGIPTSVAEELRSMGHEIKVADGWARKVAGKGQIIQQVRDPSGRRVWACGSDLRGDGCAVGQI